MSRLAWVADGIARARQAGGVDLECYRRPGFEAGVGVRRASEGAGVAGIPLDPERCDPDWDEYEDGLRLRRRRKR